MKKYLMTGIAALAMCFGFTSCSHDIEPASQEDLNKLEAEQIVNAYNQAFIKTFGQPAANQDWGFGTTTTRGITRSGSEPNQTVWPNYGYPQKPGSLKTTTPSGKSEEQIVTEWFQTHTIADAVTLDCNDYWVLQVHYKNYDYPAIHHEWEKYENGQEVWKTAGDVVNPIGHMDQIYANRDANSTSYDHIYNFNTNSGSFMLVLDSETKFGFGYEESWGTHNKHVYGNSFMAHIVDEANGIDGYYVGFDYQAYKLEDVQYTNDKGETVTYKNNKAWAVEPDGVYDDRIIKIVPGKDKAPDYDVRIIAEDLNATAQDGDLENSDWDFNDVVFDVKFTSDNDAEITLIAAGGTLPLVVGIVPQDGVDSYPDNEVHALFGVPVNYMVNTNAEAKGLTGGAPAAGRQAPKINFTKTGVKASNGKDIPIYVQKTLKNGTKKWFQLTAEKGQPASKLAVNSKSSKFSICDERQDIKIKYPNFKSWVVNNDPLIWWK